MSRDPRPRRYTLYVAEVLTRDGKRVLYVGSTARKLRQRKARHEHLGFGHRRRVVRMRRYGSYPSRAEAERAERVLAKRLRERGAHVIGGH